MCVVYQSEVHGIARSQRIASLVMFESMTFRDNEPRKCQFHTRKSFCALTTSPSVQTARHTSSAIQRMSLLELLTQPDTREYLFGHSEQMKCLKMGWNSNGRRDLSLILLAPFKKFTSMNFQCDKIFSSHF